MSVVKAKRKPSDFEVFHHLTKMRQEITDLLLRDFGYKTQKANKNIERMFGGRSYDKLNDNEKANYDKRKKRDEAFCEWFIIDERKAVTDCLRNITSYVYMANSIYPMYEKELIERRVYQDKAIGLCYALVQELQYAIETLPVDVNVYLRFAEMIDKEITLIKAWRKSDNRFKKTIKAPSDSAANFANVNNNGNANYNNASNANGVRPDFDGTNKSTCVSC